MAEYLNSISGGGTHEHLSRKLSKEYINETSRVFVNFCTSLRTAGYTIENINIKDIGDDEVEIFFKHLKTKNISDTTHSKNFVILKAFVNWVIKVKSLDIPNVFRRAKLKFSSTKRNLMKPEQFQQLLSIITPENGHKTLKSGKKLNVFTTWLKTAIQLAMETGLRREEIFQLRWSNIRNISNDNDPRLIIDTNNLKVNRQQFGTDTGKNMKPIPVTKGLFKLLLELGYEEKMNEDTYLVVRAPELKIDYLLDQLTRGFSHYLKQVTDLKIEFKDLRKTYINYLSKHLGDKTKLFTGHSDDQVLRDSYLNKEFMAGNLSNIDLFKVSQKKILFRRVNYIEIL
ncbi:MAG TPA: tyrosine-type recombinase/integrase [Bacteroidia bacterium]|jgi:integrase